jgi:hypothetical protein
MLPGRASGAFWEFWKLRAGSCKLIAKQHENQRTTTGIMDLEFESWESQTESTRKIKAK